MANRSRKSLYQKEARMESKLKEFYPALAETLEANGIHEAPAEEPAPLPSVAETRKDADYLRLKLKSAFPVEFFPKNSFDRADQRKVEPEPFYRFGGDVVAFNPVTLHYEQMSLEMAAAMVESQFSIPNAQERGTQSRAKRAIMQMILALPPASFCGLVAGYEGGVYETRGHELVIVPHTERIMAAADTKAESTPDGQLPYFDKWNPLWTELFAPLLVSPEGDQTQCEIFYQYLAGCREVIGRGYEAKIPALAIVGAAGTGKTLLGEIVNAILTGRKADPTDYLYGDTTFNSHLTGAPLWLVDDKQLRDQKTAARLKETIVGSGFQVSKKNVADQPLLYPARAILILANDDLFSRRSVPVIDAATRDKIILFKAYEGGIPPAERADRWKRFMDALPYFLAFLDQYVAPDLDRTQRMIVSAWQNPEIMQMIFDDTDDGAIHRMIQTLLEELPELDGQAMTAQTWISKMENCGEIRGDVERLCGSPERFGRRISALVERFPQLYKTGERAPSKKRERLIRIYSTDPANP